MVQKTAMVATAVVATATTVEETTPAVVKMAQLILVAPVVAVEVAVIQI
jgi:hypothetical protein